MSNLTVEELQRQVDNLKGVVKRFQSDNARLNDENQHLHQEAEQITKRYAEYLSPEQVKLHRKLAFKAGYNQANEDLFKNLLTYE